MTARSPSRRRLEQASELVSALRATRRAQRRLGVYAPAAEQDAFAAAAEDVLGLP